MLRHEQLPIRPYARLLTMLGEQLIKNDRIALVELVKNSYDADATHVAIAFDDFGPGLTTTPEAQIVLLDNGDGMTSQIVRDHWLNPATEFKVAKKRSDRPKTDGGRVIQGEKGIGRFAMFKLGSSISMVTRAREDRYETVVDLDISFLDADATPAIGSDSAARDNSDDAAALPTALRDEPDEIAPLPLPGSYLDQLTARVTTRTPEIFDGVAQDGGASSHGTRIEIKKLRGEWSIRALERLHQDLFRLRPLGGLLTGKAGEDPLAFDVDYSVDGAAPTDLQDPELLLGNLIERAVLRVVGTFDSSLGEYSITINDSEDMVSINSANIRALRLFKEAFGKNAEEVQLLCGNFSFEFLFFDLRPSASARYRLDPQERDLVKDHRIYLYRDGVRVLPYGDPDDDWLQLDVIRGTQAASRIFSNDQTLGFVYISQESNPDLRDKTNREGLIDSGRAFSDFLLALQLVITYLRRGEFARYLALSQQRAEAESRRHIDATATRLAALEDASKGSPKITALIKDFGRAYKTEREFLILRAERTEDLAGIGLSVETASHDVVAAANQALRDLRFVHEQMGHELGLANLLYQRAGAIVDAMSFIVSRLQDVQGLFVSSRGRPKPLNAVQFAKKVQAIYRRLLSERGVAVIYTGDEKLEVKAKEATLLQIFLNLMDNSVFWLETSRVSDPAIQIRGDSSRKVIRFSDNGPGIQPDDAPYIFDAFFSAKGDEGRGLGLYIAREVARRSGFDLLLAQADAESLPGANFELDFDPS